MKFCLRLAVAAAMLGGCAAPMGVPASTGPIAYPSRAPSALGNLIGGAITQEEAELRDILKRPNEMAFPVRLGVLFYDYQSALKPEDQQAMLTTMGQELIATGLVKEAVQIPNSLLRGGETIESIRKLAARFQVDALVIVSGSQSFNRSESQPLGFFDSFTNRAYYEARGSVTAFALNVYTGTFLQPFEVVSKEGPTLLDSDSADFATSAYALRQRAENSAFSQLKTKLVETLTSLKATAVPPGSVSPQPTPTPSPSPVTP